MGNPIGLATRSHLNRKKLNLSNLPLRELLKAAA
jgi:hypothetical protein